MAGLGALGASGSLDISGLALAPGVATLIADATVIHGGTTYQISATIRGSAVLSAILSAPPVQFPCRSSMGNSPLVFQEFLDPGAMIEVGAISGVLETLG